MSHKEFLHHESDYGLPSGLVRGVGESVHHSSVPSSAYTSTLPDNKEFSEEDKIVKNALLFIAIYIKKTSEEKSREIQKHLNEGADVNAKDANNRNNTPLHIAVLKGEPEIVKLLLKRGAIIDNKNSDDKTPLDIAELSDTPNGQEIVKSLKASYHKMLTISCTTLEQSSLDKKSIEQPQSSDHASVQQQSQRNDSKRNEQKKSQFHYSKRPGTSGLSGQLYETKLLTLLLFRALNDKEINEFYLGTNVDGIGALDDIIFRYNVNGQENPRVKFIQAKHKDNPDKERVTISEIQKKDKDFSLNKYLDSYLRIKQRFNSKSNDDLFKTNFRDIDCEFVIYTTAKEEFGKKKVQDQYNTRKKDLIYTSETGKTFQFEYEDDDINLLVKTASESRTKLLAETFAKFILSDKSHHNTIMSDELIKTYHIVLAQKVIEVSDIGPGNYRKGKFRPEFFSSTEYLMSILRKTLYKETEHCKKSKLQAKEIKNSVDEILKNPSADSISKLIGSTLTFEAERKRLKFIVKEISQELSQSRNDFEKLEVTQETVNEAIKKKMASLSFKLPSAFGNLDFMIKKKRLNHLTLQFIELLKNASTNNIVKIDDNIVGHGKMLTDGDMAINGGIGGLVGNLLILDEETKLLKFNNDEKSLPKDAKQLFDNLKREISKHDLRDKNVSSYKFDINVIGFPKLSLISDERDKNLIKGFLDKLWFYTNQAKEDEVEKILKEEIYKRYKAYKKQDEFTFRINTDAIFLKVHNEVQKWWKQPETANYLTKSCNFFDQAEKDIIDSPLLTTLNFIYVNKYKKNIINFSQDAIQTLELDKFTESPNERILNIITDEIILSSVKLAQYFENKNSNDHTFLDLDYVSRTSCCEQAISEFIAGTLEILIIGPKENSAAGIISVEKIYTELKGVMNNKSKSSKKIILLTKRHDILAENFKKDFPYKYIEKIDEKNKLINLTPESQTKILENSKVIFQGDEINLGILIDKKSEHLIDGEVLSKLINDEKIEIGETLTNSRLKDVEDYYIDRTFNRHIKIKEGFKKVESKFIITDNDQVLKFNPLQNQDIDLISDKEEDFKKLRAKYKDRSIHWLERQRDEFIWQQSHGVLYKLLDFVDTNEQGNQEYKPRKSPWNEKEFRSAVLHKNLQIQECKPNRITDIPERVVIIAAEPGMGKSTVLAPLALKTKEINPSLWTVRINLLDQSSRLEKWQKDETVIDESQAIRFLYGTLFQKFFLDLRGNEKQKEKNKEQIINNILELIESNSKMTLKNNEESKIKGLSVLEVRLFYNFYKQGKIALLFDGFDEISPNYKYQVIELLEVLKGTKVEKIWITTRPYNIQSDLENKLGTFSYALKPFLEIEQREYLKKFWKTNLELRELDEKRSEVFINELLYRFSKSTNDQERRFVGIPLQISMIAEVFQDTFKEFYDSKIQELSTQHKQKLSEKLNLNTLYKRFINIKFYKIRFGEKKPNTNTDDPDMKEIIEENHKKFIEDHRLLAFFEDNKLKKLLSFQERSQVRSLIERIEQGGERTGIIGIINGKPNFIHHSFAEYFVASFIWENFKSIQFDKIGKDLIKRIIINNLIEDNRIQICKFFQLETQKDLENNVDFPDKEGKLKKLLTRIVDSYRLYNYYNKSAKLLLKIIELYLSEKEGSFLDIPKELLQDIQRDNKFELLCASAQNGYLRLADSLIKLGKFSTKFLRKCLKNASWNFTPLWLAAKNGHLDIVEIVVKKLSYDFTWKDSYGDTLFQRIIRLNQFDVLRSCLKLDIINVPHSTYYGYNSIERLSLFDCIKRNAPLDVIELLIEKTDVDFVNQLKIDQKPTALDITKLIHCNKNILNLLVEKGIDLSASYDDALLLINLVTHEKESILYSTFLDCHSYFSNIYFSKFFNLVKSLLEYGAIYNLEGEDGNTILKNVKQTHYILKLFEAVLQTADEESDTVSNILDKISDKVLQLLIKSLCVKYSDFCQGYEISIDYLDSNKISFLTRYDNVKYEKYHRKRPPMREISFVPEYIQRLFFQAYQNGDTECSVIKYTLYKLSLLIEDFRQEIEELSYGGYTVDEILEQLRMEANISTYNCDMSLLRRISEICCIQNYRIDEAFTEVSDHALKLTKKIKSFVKNLPKIKEDECLVAELWPPKIKNYNDILYSQSKRKDREHQTKFYTSDEVLKILGLEDIDLSKINESNGILDLISKINESDGIYFLNNILLELSDVCQKNKKRMLEYILTLSEQSSETFKLLKTTEDLFDAIKTKNKENVVSILQEVKSSFIKAVINARNKQRQTVLDLACEHYNVEIINLLLRYGAKFGNDYLDLFHGSQVQSYLDDGTFSQDNVDECIADKELPCRRAVDSDKDLSCFPTDDSDSDSSI